MGNENLALSERWICTKRAHLGTNEVWWPHIRGGFYEGFHCNLSAWAVESNTRAMQALAAPIWQPFMDRYTLALIFGHLLRKDMDGFVDYWNSHPIRRNRNVASPSGRPCDIYDMPSLYGMIMPHKTTSNVICFALSFSIPTRLFYLMHIILVVIFSWVKAMRSFTDLTNCYRNDITNESSRLTDSGGGVMIRVIPVRLSYRPSWSTAQLHQATVGILWVWLWNYSFTNRKLLFMVHAGTWTFL